MSRNIKRQAKEYFQAQRVQPSAPHITQTAKLCREAYALGQGKTRSGFLRFLLQQLGFIPKSVFIVQGVVLLLVCGMLQQVMTAGSLYRWFPVTYPAFLGGCGILFAVLNIPFLQRSARYQMLELETSTRVAMPRLLMARLIILGTANLAAILLVSWFAASGRQAWDSAVFILLPYLLACAGCVCIVSTGGGRMSTVYSCILCGGLFGLLLLLSRLNPDLFIDIYIGIWWLVCIPAFIALVAALRTVLAQSKTLNTQRA